MPSTTLHAIAYLLTWTTYGTWLRGDGRGYVGRTLEGDDTVAPAQNEFGTPYAANNGRTGNWDANALKSPPVHLSAEQALCVAQALCEAANRAGYDLARAAVMTDHVHAVVGVHPDGKSEIIRRLKSVTAVRLTQRFGRPGAAVGQTQRGAGNASSGGRWWTRSGSEREKWDEGAVAAAIEYVGGQSHKLAEVVDGRVVQVAKDCSQSGHPPTKVGGSCG